MMSDAERLAKIVDELAQAVADVLARNEVDREQYREGVQFLARVQAEREIPLLVDLFIEHLVVKAEDKRGRNSSQAIQGPYFIEEVPWVSGALKVSPEDNGDPLLIRGRVTAPDDTPIEGATVYIWHSTPDGAYTGFHKGMSSDLYRGRVRSAADGSFQVATTMPVPYTIPDQGPVGGLLSMMGRHSWRPAHVHFKLRADGYRDLTTQTYFAGGKWVDDDCAGGIVDDLIFTPLIEDDQKVLQVDFVLDFAKSAAEAA
ncbi:dioxygenase family protein [Rhizorhabdus sp.]|uniref:dioxygenase family protein n=1 Tax=Rhizorhabdus sp. TaxID=1968843 RepID=UPI0004A8118A|nr:dioxygenase [Rhizorhabdus sp.]MBP8232022.1 catechol 1,2-dioxygenase [Rhizorhabdus sp.]